MDPQGIAELLRPFLTDTALPAPGVLEEDQVRSMSTYIDILLRWNARLNLTSVRDPESIVTRHFGESLFLAAYLFPRSGSLPGGTARQLRRALDLGSGAGFPGLPLKIYVPELQVRLVESNQKKATFLREVIRSLRLTNVEVMAQRLEAASTRGGRGPGADVQPGSNIEYPDLVTMRAVERFESALSTAATVARKGSAQHRAGKLALLIGAGQVGRAAEMLSDFSWEAPKRVPQSEQRVLLVGTHPAEHESK